MAAATRGLRPLLAPPRPSARAPRATPGLTRAGSNVRDQTRESRARSTKEMKRGDVKAPSPSAEMSAQTDMMRNKMLLPGVSYPLFLWTSVLPPRANSRRRVQKHRNTGDVAG